MNILLLTSVYPNPDENNENVTKVVQYFAREWRLQGHTVKIIHNAHRYPILVHKIPSHLKEKLAARISFYIPDYNSVKPMSFSDNGVQVWKMPILKWIPHGNHTKHSLRKQTKKIYKLLQEIGFEPDIIMGHWMSPQAQLICELKKYFHCRTSIVLHGQDYIDNKRFNCIKYLNQIDVIGCRSKTESEYIQKKLHLQQLPFVCYSGVPDQFVDQYLYDKSKFEQVPTVWRILYVGRLVEYKNVDKILLALAKLEQTNYIFDVIGSGSEERSLIKLAEKLQISDHVVFHGRKPRQEVLAYMRSAHIFTMVSKGEVFGLVYLEAMASSCITIGAMEEGIDGIIVHEENGYLTEAGNAEKLCILLDNIMKQEMCCLQEITRKGYETATQYTDSKVAKKYLENVMVQKT